MVEKEFLDKLKQIRAALVTAKTEGTNDTNSRELQAENEALKAKNVKLAYRVQHCVRNIEELMDENRALKEAVEANRLAEF
jgi:FtsZ-binding cell division protein ZapB